MAMVAGIDIGAGTAKVVIFGEGRILSYSVLPSGYDSLKAARSVTRQALKKAAVLVFSRFQGKTIPYIKFLA